MESRSSRTKKKPDYTVTWETEDYLEINPRSYNMADDLEDFRLEGTGHKKIRSLTVKRDPTVDGSKRTHISIMARKEQEDLEKALKLSLMEGNSKVERKPKRTLITDIQTDSSILITNPKHASPRLGDHSRSKCSTESTFGSQQNLPRDNGDVSCVSFSQTFDSESQVSDDISRFEDGEEGQLKTKVTKEISSLKEVENSFDNDNLSGSGGTDVTSSEEVALVPQTKPKMKCESQISYTQSSVPNQQGDSLQIEHTDAVLSNASPSKSKQSVLTTPNAMTEVDIVIPKHNLGKSHTYYDYMNIHMEMNENLVKYPQSPAPSARKKRFQTVEPYNKHESTLTYTETKSERNSELPSSQSKISEKMSGESEDEFEDIVSKPMPKLKASSGLKVKRLITSKPKKGDYLSENSDGTHLDIHDLDVYSPVKRINCISSSKSMSLPNPSITPLKNIRTVEVTRQIRNTFSSTGVCKASIGLKASSSVKPLLTNKLVTQPNSNSSPSSPIVFGGPARVGLTRKHKSKPLHPYLQSL